MADTITPITADALRCMLPVEWITTWRLIAEGYSYQQIARRQDLTVDAVGHRILHTKTRLHCDTNAQVVELLRSRGIIDPQPKEAES
jgi:DNA-binding CsgD family transcriptional regulator